MKRFLRWLGRRYFPGWQPLFWLMAALAMIYAIALVACGAAQHVPECDGKPRHALTAELAADLAICGDDVECIDEAEAAHDKRREAWVRCEP